MTFPHIWHFVDEKMGTVQYASETRSKYIS